MLIQELESGPAPLHLQPAVHIRCDHVVPSSTEESCIRQPGLLCAGSNSTGSNAAQQPGPSFRRPASSSAEPREAARAAAISRSLGSTDNGTTAPRQPALTGLREAAPPASTQRQQSHDRFTTSSQPSSSRAGPSHAPPLHPLRSAAPNTHDSHFGRGFAASGCPSHQPTQFSPPWARSGNASSPQQGGDRADIQTAADATPGQLQTSLSASHGSSLDSSQTAGPDSSQGSCSMQDGAVIREASSREASSSATGTDAVGQAPAGRTRRPSLRHSFDRFLKTTHSQSERSPAFASPFPRPSYRPS